MSHDSTAIATLADIPDLHSSAAPDRSTLISAARSSGQRQLGANSNRVANGLIGLGLAPQSRVAMLACDSVDGYEILFGCARAGMVFTPINWRLEASASAYIVRDAEAQVLFIDHDLLALLPALAAECPRLKTVVVLNGEAGAPRPYAAWRDLHAPDRPAIAIGANDPVVQVYTSGTSGRPKGVVLAHRNFLALTQELERAGDPMIAWKDGDVSLVALPMFHIGGLWWALQGLIHGAQNVLMKAFIGWQALDLIERHRITKLAFVPAMLQFMLSETACHERNLTSVDLIIYGGSPMPRGLLAKAQALFAGASFAQNYGMSETSNLAIFLPPGEHAALSPERAGAAGRALRGVGVRIIAPDGEQLPAGAVGEICLKTPVNMLGYWKLPQETAATLVDGWIHTGDAGYVDADGYVFVTDRIKDMIISGGEKIFPAEIERVLREHPDVADVAVIGVPDERWGEVPVAYLVRRAGSTLGKPEAMAFARSRLAPFKMLRTMEFVDSLPRNASGKVLKRTLRAAHGAPAPAPPSLA